MGKIADLEDAILRRPGGTLEGKSRWNVTQLQDYLDSLPPEPSLPRRRGAAVKSDEKRKSEQPLEQPSPKLMATR